MCHFAVTVFAIVWINKLLCSSFGSEDLLQQMLFTLL